MENKQEDFWSNNPCGSEGNFEIIRNQRFNLEPYLPKVLSDLRKPNSKFLEVGCGQGVDAITICAKLPKDSVYIAIDFSPASIEDAKNHTKQFAEVGGLSVNPIFFVGDALDINFGNEDFDFVYSIGVIHHTPNPKKAVSEIHRVLKNCGEATIFLYRSGSLKVVVAKLLRSLQKAVDKILGTERVFYNLLKKKKSKIFGTMFLECFGVPILESYNNVEINEMFQNFSKVKFQPYGYNIHFLNKNKTDGFNKNGYLWRIDVVK